MSRYIANSTTLPLQDPDGTPVSSQLSFTLLSTDGTTLPQLIVAYKAPRTDGEPKRRGGPEMVMGHQAGHRPGWLDFSDDGRQLRLSPGSGDVTGLLVMALVYAGNSGLLEVRLTTGSQEVAQPYELQLLDGTRAVLVAAALPDQALHVATLNAPRRPGLGMAMADAGWEMPESESWQARPAPGTGGDWSGMLHPRQL
ncbi:hypothetical protein JNJ66_05385 [Candidatus Saccharibacteria bacterium]|nr:hypothetical protein [Candidatus Saccharibacteria bacterium]